MLVDALRARKARLRAAMQAARAAIPDAERAQRSRLVEERLLTLLGRLDPRVVTVFSSFGSEVDTHGVIARLHGAGRRIALPVVAGRELRAVGFQPGDPVRTARYGASEPTAPRGVPPAQIDVVIVPGLAFDAQGYRIGYGRGYYDRFLRRVRPNVPRIGVAFQIQVVAEVPHGPGDTPVDAVVTDTQIVHCRPERLPGVIPS